MSNWKEKVVKLYRDTYMSFSDEEIELFAEYGLHWLLGARGDSLKDERPGDKSFKGRLDYEQFIKPLITDCCKMTKEDFDVLVSDFYGKVYSFPIMFYRNLDEADLRKYERQDHEKFVEEIEDFISSRLQEGQ